LGEEVEPLSLILSLALQHPQAVGQAVRSYNAPGVVNTANIESSLADFARETLRCYHPSARFRDVNFVAAPWPEHYKFGAQSSAVIQISFTGLTGQPYQMLIAAMAKDRSYRTFVLGETSTIRYNRNCEFENWKQVN